MTTMMMMNLLATMFPDAHNQTEEADLSSLEEDMTMMKMMKTKMMKTTTTRTMTMRTMMMRTTTTMRMTTMKMTSLPEDTVLTLLRDRVEVPLLMEDPVPNQDTTEQTDPFI